MNNEQATTIFDSLSSGVRLEVWRLLVKAGHEGKVAGEMAREMDIAANSMSFHLKAMLHAGMVSVEQEGRYQRYRANLSLMLELISYMTEACCSDDPTTTCEPIELSTLCPSCDSTDKRQK